MLRNYKQKCTAKYVSVATTFLLTYGESIQAKSQHFQVEGGTVCVCDQLACRTFSLLIQMNGYVEDRCMGVPITSGRDKSGPYLFRR
jgi:hypothetical protein